MSNPTSSPSSTSVFVRDRLALTIVAFVLGASALSWVASYYLMMSSQSTMMMQGDMGGFSWMFSSISSIGFFETVWIVGMVAMMFPAMIPIVLFYGKVMSKLEENKLLTKVIGTPLFLGGYVVVYALLGVGAYLVVFAGVFYLPQTLLSSSLLSSSIPPSAVLVLAGAYQFSSLKTRCLSNCISPIGFFSIHSHRGLLGSFRMGLAHGAYCVGCCWAFMLVMVAVGAMSVPFMALLAGVVAVEKLISKGSRWFSAGISLGFFAGGILVLAYPSLLMAF